MRSFAESTWPTDCSSPTSGMDCKAAGTDVAAYIKTLAPPGVDSSKLTVTPTWPKTAAGNSAANCTTAANNPGCVVQVQVTCQFSFIAPFMPNKAPLFSATANQVIQY